MIVKINPLRTGSITPRNLSTWFGLIVTIVLFSVFGRALLRIFEQFVGRENLTWLIPIMLGVPLIIWWARQRPRLSKEVIFQMVWIAVAAGVFMLITPHVEEGVHLLLFGLLGYFSLALFYPASGLMVCAAVSGLDELLQWVLPDRVGDWRDVAMNLAAALAGALLAMTDSRNRFRDSASA